MKNRMISGIGSRVREYLKISMTIGALWDQSAIVGNGQVEIQGSVSRIGILGCLRQGEPSPGLYRYLEAAPDICLWVGDNIYADTRDDPGVLEACYSSLAARPVFKS